jgi:formate dehydrogenase alpha subunit
MIMDGMKKVLTTCPYCGCGCRFYLDVMDGDVIGVTPTTYSISKGRLCVKGWNAHEFIHSTDRLRKPLIKKDDEFVESTWEEALDFVAKRLKDIKEEYGSDSLAVLSSAKCTNEENFLMMKFARAVLGTNNIDHCARLCHAPTVVGLTKAFGGGTMTNSIDEITRADVILVIGSNTTETHPLVGSEMIKAVENGSKLIVVDPRITPLAKLAKIHLRVRLGSDVALLNGMMNVIINEGLEEKKFIEEKTEGFEELHKTVEKYTPEKVEEISGIRAYDLKSAARMYAKAERGMIIYCLGITQHVTGTDNVLSLANLALLTGNVGKEGTGVNALRGQNNVQGACDMGALPDVYTGYQPVTDDKVRKKFERAWKVPLPRDVGLTVVEMMDAAADGKIKGMYISGENPMLSDPDINHVRNALEKLDILIVQDIFLTETAELADVVLPGCSYAEKNGTFTNTERRVQLVRKAIYPICSKEEWKIVCELANRFGYEMNYESPRQIMEELSKLTPIYGGISHERLEDGGLQWPCPAKDHPGTKYLYENGFSRPGEKGKFHAIEYIFPDEIPDEEYPFLLTTGRVSAHCNTGTMTRRSGTLNREFPKGFAEINPADAKEIGVLKGQKVKVSTRRGEIIINAMITDELPEKTLFIPFHFSEEVTNVLTNPAIDPISNIPEFKVCAANIERINDVGDR